MEVGRPVSAILYGLSRGAIMLYNGQEIGETGEGAEGFGSDDARTSIFDYWSMPEFTKWVNDHKYDGARLSAEQQSLRSFYQRLIHLVGEAAFRDGKFLSLNPGNRDNPAFGRFPGDQASGHWLYAFLRYDVSSTQRFLVVANLHTTISFQNVRVLLPGAALRFLDLDEHPSDTQLKLMERLGERGTGTVVGIEDAAKAGVPISEMPALSAFYFEFV
jgi:glycosidase